MTAAAFGIDYTDSEHDNKKERGDKILIPKRTPPPKGTKEYFFNIQGDFSNTSMLKSDCVFTCFAINDKNAVKKFKKYIQT